MSADQIYLPEISDHVTKDFPFINCIRNNYRHIRKMAKRTKTDCFRIYDRDISSHLYAIDFYAGRFCLQCYGKDDAVPDVTPVKEALLTLFSPLAPNIFPRVRQRNKEGRQYEKLQDSGKFFVGREHGVPFLINLSEYLDSGLFLDHRKTRQIVAKASAGKRLLNLFSYTGAFSVHAAVQGALSTLSVDMSNTYTAWCRENFLLNRLCLKTHQIIRADCLKYLKEETDQRYDVIVIDPPTISRSKKMEGLFDVQEDYPFLLKQAAKRLAPHGVIYFSTNLRTFRFSLDFLPGFIAHEITKETIPEDFHDKKIHRAFKIFAPI